MSQPGKAPAYNYYTIPTTLITGEHSLYQVLEDPNLVTALMRANLDTKLAVREASKKELSLIATRSGRKMQASDVERLLQWAALPRKYKDKDAIALRPLLLKRWVDGKKEIKDVGIGDLISKEWGSEALMESAERKMEQNQEPNCRWRKRSE